MALTGKQAVVGCAIAAAACALVGLAILIGVGVWLKRPGELIEPARLAAEDATGYVEWTLAREDAGTAGFVRALGRAFDETQRRGLEAVPAPLRGVIALTQGGSGREVEKLLPMAVVWTSSPGANAGEDLRLLSISMASVGNRLRIADWTLGFVFSGQEGMAVREYEGERVFQIQGQDPGDDDFTFFLRGNDAFFVTDFDTAERAIVRLNAVAAPATRAPTELDRLFASTPEGSALRGAITNESGELARLWQTVAWDATEPLAWEDVSGVVLDGGLTADGAFDGSLALLGRDPAWARERSLPLVQAVESWIALLASDIETTSSVEDDRVRIEVRAENLVQRLQGQP